jgi:hypothetical protein
MARFEPAGFAPGRREEKGFGFRAEGGAPRASVVIENRESAFFA